MSSLVGGRPDEPLHGFLGRRALAAVLAAVAGRAAGPAAPAAEGRRPRLLAGPRPLPSSPVGVPVAREEDPHFSVAFGPEQSTMLLLGDGDQVEEDAWMPSMSSTHFVSVLFFLYFSPQIRPRKRAFGLPAAHRAPDANW